MSAYTIDPIKWFTEREVDYPPVHFLTCRTPLTLESKQWILDNLRGRYSVTQNNLMFLLDNSSIGIVSFEDPKEATLYELKWS